MLTDIRQALVASLSNIAGLTVTATAPAVVNPPCAYIALAPRTPITFHKVGGYGDVVVLWQVTVLVSLASREDAQVKLDTFLMQAGVSSVKDALESASFDNKAQYCYVKEIYEMGGITYNDTLYLGCKFTVETWSDRI